MVQDMGKKKNQYIQFLERYIVLTSLSHLYSLEGFVDGVVSRRSREIISSDASGYSAGDVSTRVLYPVLVSIFEKDIAQLERDKKCHNHDSGAWVEGERLAYFHSSSGSLLG